MYTALTHMITVQEQWSLTCMLYTTKIHVRLHIIDSSEQCAVGLELLKPLYSTPGTTIDNTESHWQHVTHTSSLSTSTV